MDQLNSSLARVKFGKEVVVIEEASEKSVDLRPEQTIDDKDQEIIEETESTTLEGSYIIYRLTLANNPSIHVLL